MSNGPTTNRAESSGDIWTPQVFRSAVAERFGLPSWDLAASKQNAFAPYWFDETEDSLVQQWHGLEGPLWLNPPYSSITPWARKCASERALGAEILLLVPASVGANWFWDHVALKASVYSVGRMVFDNCFDRKTGALVTTPYPKDLMLCHYDPLHVPEQCVLERWQWQ